MGSGYSWYSLHTHTPVHEPKRPCHSYCGWLQNPTHQLVQDSVHPLQDFHVKHEFIIGFDLHVKKQKRSEWYFFMKREVQKLSICSNYVLYIYIYTYLFVYLFIDLFIYFNILYIYTCTYWGFDQNKTCKCYINVTKFKPWVTGCL